MISFAPLLDNLREKAPLVHCITNYVTANDCANVLLACGASPVMADDPGEAAEITSRADGLLLNLGTISERRSKAMLCSGRRARELGLPVVLDPVGIGASGLRRELSDRLLGELCFSVIRGNTAEISALVGGSGGERGVDAERGNDSGTEGQTAARAAFLAKQTGAVVSATGKTDLITDGTRFCTVRNGHPMMARITGAGCMLSALTAAFVAANRETPFEAACAAVILMGVSGETAYAHMGERDGNATFRNYLIDAVFQMSAQTLTEGARYELR